MVKTTIVIDDKLWRKFIIKVIEKHGGRKTKYVINKLIQKYVDSSNGEN